MKYLFTIALSLAACATVRSADPTVVSYSAEMQKCVDVSLADGGGGWPTFDACVKTVKAKYQDAGAVVDAGAAE